MHFERYKDSPSRQVEYEDAISSSAILEESMVSSLRAVFSMLIEAIRNARLATSNSPGDVLPDRVAHYGNEACRLLTKARDQLIAEATGTVPERDIGPVVTPEAILIKTIDRLARGVYGSGTVDVINILEECLEQLVSHMLSYRHGCSSLLTHDVYRLSGSRNTPAGDCFRS